MLLTKTELSVELQRKESALATIRKEKDELIERKSKVYDFKPDTEEGKKAKEKALESLENQIRAKIKVENDMASEVDVMKVEFLAMPEDPVQLTRR
jgi:hypothetical protein